MKTMTLVRYLDMWRYLVTCHIKDLTRDKKKILKKFKKKIKKLKKKLKNPEADT